MASVLCLSILLHQLTSLREEQKGEEKTVGQTILIPSFKSNPFCKDFFDEFPKINDDEALATSYPVHLLHTQFTFGDHSIERLGLLQQLLIELSPQLRRYQSSAIHIGVRLLPLRTSRIFTNTSFTHKFRYHPIK